MSVPPPKACEAIAMQRPYATESGAMSFAYRLAARFPGHEFSVLDLRRKRPATDERGENLPYHPPGFYVIYAGHMSELEGIDGQPF